MFSAAATHLAKIRNILHVDRQEMKEKNGETAKFPLSQELRGGVLNTLMILKWIHLDLKQKIQSLMDKTLSPFSVYLCIMLHNGRRKFDLYEREQETAETKSGVISC